MQMCSRCQRRIAVVFVTRVEGENQDAINEGLCLQCARELGIKPVNDMLSRMGISEEDIDRMTEDLSNAMTSAMQAQDDVGALDAP